MVILNRLFSEYWLKATVLGGLVVIYPVPLFNAAKPVFICSIIVKNLFLPLSVQGAPVHLGATT